MAWQAGGFRLPSRHHIWRGPVTRGRFLLLFSFGSADTEPTVSGQGDEGQEHSGGRMRFRPEARDSGCGRW